MSDICPVRQDWMEGSIFMNVLSIDHPQDRLFEPFIIIKMQVGTISPCTLSRFSPATSLGNDSILKDLVLLSLGCVSYFLWFFLCNPWQHSALWLHYSFRIWSNRRSWPLSRGVKTIILPLSIFLSILGWLKPISNYTYLVQAGVDEEEKKLAFILQNFSARAKIQDGFMDRSS